jgi:hypothetical protein
MYERDPENDWIMDRERIRMVAARQPLGRHVQSPPPPYDSGEEHNGFQQGASRETSPDKSYRWAKLIQLLQGGSTESNPDETRRPSS